MLIHEMTEDECRTLVARLQALARPDAAGAHTVLPIAGARARIGGDTSARLGVTLDETRLHRRTTADPEDPAPRQPIAVPLGDVGFHVIDRINQTERQIFRNTCRVRRWFPRRRRWA